MFFVLALGFGSGCGPPDVVLPTKPPTGASLPTVGATGWVGSTQGEVLATVNGQPLTQRDSDSQRTGSDAISGKALVERMVRGEVLAQFAASNDAMLNDESVEQAWRRALARAYLEREFEPSVSPSGIDMVKLAQFYKRFRVRYFHEAVYTVGHLHFVCCLPSTEDCGSASVLECFATTYPLVQDVHRQAKEALADAVGNPASLEVGMEALHELLRGEFPKLAYEKFPFFYDTDTPHAKQAGRYDLVDEAFARAVVPMPVGAVSEPVRTAYGWHVVGKFEQRQARKATLEDASVVNELRELLLPAYTRHRFAQWLSADSKSRAVTITPEPLDDLDDYWSGGATAP